MSGPARAAHSQNVLAPAEAWNQLLRHDVELAPAFSNELNARMRAERLTFGDRVHCPFIRPFFLTAADEQRVREIAEAIAGLGERVVKQSLAAGAVCAQPGRGASGAHQSRLRYFEHLFATRRVSASRFTAIRGIQCRIAGRRRIRRNAGGSVSNLADYGALLARIFGAEISVD